MSEHAERHRKAAKAKAKRLAEHREGKVDGSDYGPASQEMFGEQTYPKAPKPRAYKRGGKVMGETATHHAGKTPRCTGGRMAGGGGVPVPVQAAPFAGGPTPRIGNRPPIGLAPPGVQSRHPGMNLPLARKAGGRANFISKAIKHPGALHKELHVPEGEKIPEKKLHAAEHSSNPKERKRAEFAEELKGFHHKLGGRAEGNVVRRNERRTRAEGGEVPPTRFSFSGSEPGEMARAAGLKRGGRAKEAAGGMPNNSLRKNVVKPDEEFRSERKSGGRAGKGSKINIIIAQHPGGAQSPGIDAGPQAPKPVNMPVPPPQPQMPPPGAMPPAPGGAAAGPPPPMPAQGGGGGGGFGGRPMR